MEFLPSEIPEAEMTRSLQAVIGQAYVLFEDPNLRALPLSKLPAFFAYLGRFVPQEDLGTRIYPQLLTPEQLQIIENSKQKKIPETVDHVKDKEIEEEGESEKEKVSSKLSEEPSSEVKENENSEKAVVEHNDITPSLTQTTNVPEILLTLEQLAPLTLSVLISKDWPVPSVANYGPMLQALDPEGRGYIEITQLKLMLEGVEDGLTPSEIENFINFAKSKKNPNRVYLEEYLLNYHDLLQSKYRNLYHIE